MIRPALILGLLAGAQTDALAPSVTADLDGSGRTQTVTVTASGGDVRMEIRDAGGRKLASAKASAPRAEVVHVALTSAPIGSAGSLVQVSASTDASECVSVWRFRDGALAQLPLKRADGKVVPDCATSGQWTYRWEREAEGQLSRMLRERDERVAQGLLRVREVFSFAGFSLDFDSGRSSTEINGVPIPSWYAATLYTRAALEKLYLRFDLAQFEAEPTLTIRTDRERGIFELRFEGPGGAIVAPVDAYAFSSGTASLSGKVGQQTAHVTVRLAGEGVPYETRVEGLGRELDGIYGPAGSWHGGARQVFPSATDELASEELAGVWDDARGGKTTIAIEGAPPYRVRMGKTAYTLDTKGATPPLDLLLRPADGPGQAWGIVLRGPNAIERVPLACTGEGAERTCRSDGERETLRRLGALVNVR